VRRGPARLALGVLASLSAPLLVAAPGHADERDIGSGSVRITVQIDPIECATGCGGGSAPGAGGLPATGLASIEPLLWIAMALLMAGAVFALRARSARHSRLIAAAGSPSPYAVVSGERAHAVEDPSPDAQATRRRIERGDGA